MKNRASYGVDILDRISRSAKRSRCNFLIGQGKSRWLGGVDVVMAVWWRFQLMIVLGTPPPGVLRNVQHALRQESLDCGLTEINGY